MNSMDYGFIHGFFQILTSMHPSIHPSLHPSLSNLRFLFCLPYNRYHDIEEKGETIHRLLAANRQYFSTSVESECWKAYVDYVDEMIVDGFFNTIHCTLGMLIENTGKKDKVGVVMKAQGKEVKTANQN